MAQGELSRHSDVDRDPAHRILVQRTDERFSHCNKGLLYELGTAIPEAPVEALIYTPEDPDPAPEVAVRLWLPMTWR